MKRILLFFILVILSYTFVQAETLFHFKNIGHNDFGLSHANKILNVDLGIKLKDLRNLSEFNIELENGIDLTIIVEHIKILADDSYQIVGIIKDDPYSNIVLILKNGIISGEFTAILGVI